MAEIRIKKIFIAGGIVLYLAFLLVYINDAYPLVGHDYRYFLPRMVDTYVHYRDNGLSIQWFTPSFGGGLPAYPHPQHLQFSLNQILTFLVNPWLANLIAISLLTMVGYFSFYRLLTDEIRVGWKSGVLGALFFSANGMLIQHSSTGTGYDGFPLIALVVLVLISRKVSIGWAGVVIGLVLTLWVHSAGFYLFVILALTCLMAIPLSGYITSRSVQVGAAVQKALAGIVMFSLLSAGKLFAVLSYMQHFPRVVIDNYYSNFGSSVIGFVLQLIGVPIFTLPLGYLRDDPAAVGKMMTALVGGGQFGLWEMDVSISPVLAFILFYRVRKLFGRINVRGSIRIPVLKMRKAQAYSGIALVLAAWLVFEFTSAWGVFYPFMQNLPVLSSLHNNIRYAAACVLPLAMLGAYVFEGELREVEVSRHLRIFVFFFSGTLLWLGVYFFLPNDLQSRNFNIEQTLNDYQRAREGERFYVSDVEDLIDFQVFSRHATSLYPYEPIFGYNNEEFFTQLTPGSIFLEENGYYNLTNPRSLVYDTDELFTRFTTDQRGMMEEFANYRQPDWEIPTMQGILNAVSAGTMFLLAGSGLVVLAKRMSLFNRGNG